MKTRNEKIFSSGLSVERDWQKALGSLTAKAKEKLKVLSHQLEILFVSEGYPHFNPLILSARLTEQLPCQVLIGCNASGVIGREQEIEMGPAISLIVMHLPGVNLHPFSIPAFEVNSLKGETELIKRLDLYPNEQPHFICLADSMSTDVEGFLQVLNQTYPGQPVIGGLASGAAVGTPNWLAFNNEIFEEGVVGVALTGEVRFDFVVSQGCRPIGERFIITRAEQNILYELASKPALEILQQVVNQLSPSDRKLAKHSLFVGLAMKEQQRTFQRGDFLIRNIIGLDQQTGALAIGAMLKTGQTLQFQLRDAETSKEDLSLLLDSALPQLKTESQQGGLLVSCCGRGRNLYHKPNHDVELIQSKIGPVSLAGFFANGEIGPIGSKNYLHGYTSTLVLIR